MFPGRTEYSLISWSKSRFATNDLADSADEIANAPVERDGSLAVFLALNGISAPEIFLLGYEGLMALPGALLLGDEEAVIRHQFDVAGFESIKARVGVSVGVGHDLIQ